jgi:hypothetical protein
MTLYAERLLRSKKDLDVPVIVENHPGKWCGVRG